MDLIKFDFHWILSDNLNNAVDRLNEMKHIRLSRDEPAFLKLSNLKSQMNLNC